MLLTLQCFKKSVQLHENIALLCHLAALILAVIIHELNNWETFSPGKHFDIGCHFIFFTDVQSKFHFP